MLPYMLAVMCIFQYDTYCNIGHMCSTDVADPVPGNLVGSVSVFLEARNRMFLTGFGFNLHNRTKKPDLSKVIIK